MHTIYTIYKYALTAGMLLLVTLAKSQSLSGFSGSSKVGNTNYNYYMPLLPGSAKFTNGVVAGGPIQQVTDTSSVRDTSVAIFDLDSIPPQTVIYNTPCQFYLKSSSLAAAHKAVTGYKYYVTAGKPSGTVQVNRLQLFSYITSTDTLDFEMSFALYTASGDTVKSKNSVHFRIVAALQPELIAYGVPGALQLPSITDKEFTVQTIDSTATPVSNFNFVPSQRLRTVNYSGVNVAIQAGGSSHLDLLNNQLNLDTLNLYADTLTIQGQFTFPQTTVNIYAKVLNFVDVNGMSSYISTVPLQGPANGLPGNPGGNIYLNVLSINANPGIHFILNGGNGEPAVDTLHHPGPGGKGGNLYSNVDASSYYVSNGGFSGNMSFDPTVPYNAAPGTYNALANNAAAWMHPNFMYQLVNYYNECFFNGDTVLCAQKFRDYTNWLNYYMANNQLNVLDTFTAMQVQQLVGQMSSVLYKISNHVDYYGNPTGWVPMLSFEVEASAYQNEAANALNMLYLDELIQNANTTLAQRQGAFQVYTDSTESLITRDDATYHDLMYNQLPQIDSSISNNQQTTQYLTTRLSAINDQLNTQAQQIYDDRHRSSIFGDILGGVTDLLSVIPSPYTQGAAAIITVGVQELGTNADKNGFQEGSAFAAPITTALKPFISGYLTSQGKGLSDTLSGTAIGIIGALGGNKSASTNSSVANLFTQNQRTVNNIQASVMGVVNMYNNIVSVNSDELGSIKGGLIANDPAIGQISNQIQSLSDAQVALAHRLEQVTAAIIDTKNDVDNNLTSLARFNQASFDAGTAINQNLSVLSNNMRRKAFERLRLYYYYMAKAYQYRTLQPWTGSFVTQGLITNIDSLISASGNSPALSQGQLTGLKSLYTQTLDDIANSVLTYYSSNTPDQGQSVHFNLSAGEIQSLNAGDIVHLNLVERAGILFPSNENVRIDGLSVIKTVTKPYPGQLAQGPQGIVFNYPNESKLRKDGQSYYFNNYNYQTKHPIFWETDVNLADNSLSTNSPTASSTSLLNFLIGNNNNNLQLFSTPAAWADIQLQLKQPINSTAKLDSITVQLNYEYTPTQTGKVNIVLKTLNTWFAPLFYISTPDVFNRSSGEGGYVYRYYNQSSNNTVSVTAPQIYGRYTFVRWADDYGNPITGAGVDTTGKNTIRFTLAHDLSLNTVYQYAGPVLNLPDTVYLGDSLNYKLRLQNTGTGPVYWLLDSNSTWVKYPVKFGINDTTFTLTFDSNPDSVNTRTGVLDVASTETETQHHYIYFVQNKGTGLYINSVVPDTAIKGSLITIKGRSFKTKGVNSVKFGGVAAASFSVVSDSLITAVVGTGATGVVTLGTAKTSVSYGGFVFINAPVLTNFSPATAGRGALVTLTGNYLSTAKSVTFGGKAASSFTIISDSVITAVLGGEVTGSVSVQTIAGTATLAGFTYCSPISPSVSIKSNLTGSQCSSSPVIVTFTATPVNGGANTVYQWYKNSVTVGTNSPTYADGALNNNDTVWCIINSSAPCYAATAAKSNIIVNKVTAPVLPVVTISNNVANPVCPGSKVKFTAKLVNGGTAPVYQWVKNYNVVGTNAGTYFDSTLNTGDSVWCNVTSSAGCVTNNTAVSNSLYITLNSITPQSVSVSSAPSSGVVTFTAVTADPGPSPVYSWYKNNLAVGTNNSVYNDSSSASGDSVWCFVAARGVCVAPNPAKSNVVYNTPVITSIVPLSGPIGSIFTINGSGLDGISSISVGGGSALVLTNTSTQATVLVMPGCNTGQVSLAANLGNVSGINNFTVTTALAPNVQQGPKLRGNGTTGNYNTYEQGYSMALSADGNTALVGAPSISTVYVYTRSNGAWSQQAALVPGVTEAGYSMAGAALALSADGNAAIIGAPYDGANSGSAYIFNRSNGSWSQTADLTGSENNNAQFGISVGMSGDGQTVVVGEPGAGDAWMFNYSGGSWNYNGQFYDYAGNPSGDSYGQAVGISADASTVIVGLPATNYSTGAAAVYYYLQDYGWQTKILTPGDATNNSLQGTSVALNANGSVAVVGGPGDNYNTGAAWLYTSSGGNWPQWGGKLVAGGSTYGSSVGQSVGISADGNTVILGGPNDNNSIGAAWVFSQSNGGWVQQGNKLVGSNINDQEGGGGSGPQQGYSVALSYDGTTAFIGGIADNGATGAAWPFVAGPAIYSFTPVTGGSKDTIMITGNNFSEATYVAFDTVPAASFIVLSNTQIMAVLGAGASGNVIVKTPFGTATDSGFVFCNPVAPSVVIADSVGRDANVVVICKGTKVNFNATATNTGTTPVYQWWKNGLKVGVNSSTYTDSLLNNGDSVYVMVKGGSSCSLVDSANSKAIKFTVNALVAPTVTITDNIGVTAGATAICAGTTVNFTATAINGGSSPVYQWMKNGIAVGTNNSTYTDNQLNNGDSVMAMLTSNAACILANFANSKAVKFTVIANVTPTVNIIDSVGAVANVTTICSGTKVKFKAVATNGGITPVYQWEKNGVNVGTNSAIYTDSLLKNGDSVNVVFTGNAQCGIPGSSTSNAIKFTVNANVTPSVSIISNFPSPICANTKVTFSATAVNGGTPVYHWYKNNAAVSGNTKNYADSLLNNNDSVWCIITSTASCVTTNTAKSNVMVYLVNPKLAPTLKVTINTPTTICAGTSVTFTAAATNTGANPTYQWKKNNVNVGTNSVTYVDADLNNKDSVICVLTITAPCATPASITSAKMKFTVNPIVTPSVSITSNFPSPICAKTKVTFTANPVNAVTPAYQWYQNGKPVGGNTKNYADSLISNNNSIWVIITSSPGCITKDTSKSNVMHYIVYPKLLPTLKVTANTETTICAGTPVTFTAAATGTGTNPIYRWKKNNINVGTDSATYTDATLKNNDSVICVLTITAPCATPTSITSDKLKFTVTSAVPPQPSAIKGLVSVTAGQTNISYAVTSVAGLIYTWTVPAGVTIVSGQGTYKIVVNWGSTSGIISVTEANSCGASTPSQLTVTVPGSVAGYDPKTAFLSDDYIKAYPNPVIGTATIEFNAATANKYEVQVMNQLGQLVMSKSGLTIPGINTVSLDMSRLASTIYYVRLIDKEHGVRIIKLVKAK